MTSNCRPGTLLPRGSSSDTLGMHLLGKLSTQHRSLKVINCPDVSALYFELEKPNVKYKVYHDGDGAEDANDRMIDKNLSEM